MQVAQTRQSRHEDAPGITPVVHEEQIRELERRHDERVRGKLWVQLVLNKEHLQPPEGDSTVSKASNAPNSPAS